MMDEKMLKYRKTHKKCQFCKYFSTRFFYKECLLKDEAIVYIFFKNWLCRWYTVKDYEIDKMQSIPTEQLIEFYKEKNSKKNKEQSMPLKQARGQDE